MGQALYRKYRSRSFDEVIGQQHVTKTLKNALASGRISHAYLFTGPRGVGKTSVARILAHEVNQIPYKDDSIHLDIIEIDAASNRRIDEIRQLRERVHIAPTSAKYKVYIIDEVHMLTKEAFNALLKTLEEPPAHCIFILATTEAHKLPATIISRTQRFNFKPFEQHAAIKHLGSIAKREKIDIDAAALKLLADHGEGSFRDSISLLDQLAATGQKIEEQQVRDMLGLAPSAALEQLLQDVREGNPKAVLDTLDSLRDSGINPAAIAKQLAKALRASLLDGSSDANTPALLRELLAVPASPEPADYLEICLLEAASNNRPADSKTTATPRVTPKPPPDEVIVPTIKSPKASKPALDSFKIDDWDLIIDRAKAEAGTLYSALRLARPELTAGTLRLFFSFPLHQKKMTQADNINLLGQIIEEVSGTKLKIESLLDKSKVESKTPDKPEPKPLTSTPTSDSPLSSISNIFGNAEVLES